MLDFFYSNRTGVRRGRQEDKGKEDGTRKKYKNKEGDMDHGLSQLLGLRVIGTFSDRVPPGCTGIVAATLSGATRYYVFSSAGVQTHGLAVVEVDGRFAWLSPSDSTTLMDEEQALAAAAASSELAPSKTVHLILCKHTRPLQTQRISSCLKGSAVTLEDGTYVPSARATVVREMQTQFPRKPTLRRYLARSTEDVDEYSQFPELNASIDRDVLRRVRAALPRKAFSVKTSDASSREEARHRLLWEADGRPRAPSRRAVHSSGVPFGIDLASSSICLRPMGEKAAAPKGLHQVDFTVIATSQSRSSSTRMMPSYHAIVDALTCPHESIKATSVEAACMVGDFPQISLQAYDSVARLNMSPFLGADDRIVYSTGDPWKAPTSSAQRFGVIDSVRRIHSFSTSVDGRLVCCCHFRARVYLQEEQGNSVKIFCDRQEGFSVVCLAWRLMPAVGSAGLESGGCAFDECLSEMQPNDVFDKECIRMLRAQCRATMGAFQRDEEERDGRIEPLGVPPTMDIKGGPMKACRVAMRAYAESAREEAAAVLAGGKTIGTCNAIFNRAKRAMGHGCLCIALILGRVEEEHGWGYVCDVSSMIRLSEEEFVSSFPHQHVVDHKARLIFRDCKGPVVSQSVHFATSIQCRDFVRARVATTPFPLHRPPGKVAIADDSAGFTKMFEDMHGTGPVAHLESIRQRYSRYFPPAAVALPITMEERGRGWSEGDTFAVTSGPGRAIFGRVARTDGEFGTIVDWNADEVVLKVYQEGSSDSNQWTMGSIRISRRGTITVAHPGRGYADGDAYATLANGAKMLLKIQVNQMTRLSGVSWMEEEDLAAEGALMCDSLEVKEAEPRTIMPTFSASLSMHIERRVVCRSDALFDFEPMEMRTSAIANKSLGDFRRGEARLGIIRTRSPPGVACSWSPPDTDTARCTPIVTILHPSQRPRIEPHEANDDDRKIDGIIVRAEYEPPAGVGTTGSLHEWTNYLNYRSSGWRR